MKLKELINHNNFKIIKNTILDHGSTIIDTCFLINIFNYYLYDHSKNNFLNFKVFDKNNFCNLDNVINKNNILGIEFSIYKKDDDGNLSGGHSVCFYRCNKNEYYHDSNGNLNPYDDDLYRQASEYFVTMKKYVWVDMFFQFFTNNPDNTTEKWITFSDIVRDIFILKYPNYSIEKILVIFNDNYDSEENYYDKTSYDAITESGFFSTKRYLDKILTHVKLENKTYTGKLFGYIFRHNDIDLIYRLLEINKKNINDIYDDGYTILHYCSEHTYIIDRGIFHLLLENMHDESIINLKTKTKGLTALHMLIMTDLVYTRDDFPVSYNQYFISSLIEKGCDINLLDNDGNNIFHLAAQYLNCPLLILFKSVVGDNLTMFLLKKNNSGQTPLDVFNDAERVENSYDVVKKIINKHIRNILTIEN